MKCSKLAISLIASLFLLSTSAVALAQSEQQASTAARVTGTATASPTAPAIHTKITSMDVGNGHAVFIRADATLSAWGWNRDGQLGLGTVYDQYLPAYIPDMQNVKQAAAGFACSLVLLQDGTVWRSGNGCPGSERATDANNLIYQKQNGLPPKVQSISLGGAAALALLPDGTVWSWGNDLLHSETTEAAIPVQVPGLSDIIAVDAGDYHAMALRKDGTVWTWGYNYYGEIGNGSKELQFLPQQVKGLSKVTRIAAAKYVSAALQSDGTVWAWGKNNSGQFGPAGKKSTVSVKPLQVKGFNHIVSLKAGPSHLLGLRSDGTVWQAGGTPAAMNRVLQVSSLSHITSIAAGTDSSLALDKAGKLYTWGEAALPGAGHYFSEESKGKPELVPDPIRFVVNGQPVSMPLSAGYYKGTLMVPRSALWKELGVNVSYSTTKPDPNSYNASYSTWTLTRGDQSVAFFQTSDGPQVTVNGIKMTNPPEIVVFGASSSSITMLPFQFVCRSLGIASHWDASTRTIQFHLK
ncbi:Alpha-tubulin suppressor and related RCC1 domain-containing protein-like protein [Paenibacillus curdlanolyticus YK9]|uniref:Alpha-tubulin suppressor and related RCC1 domain-containing protein-like protein n=2 Tax=Paenibacillus curdlanolyticus TaxID=59840 RepID=E0ICR1_9BACL|nr:Alpha-tubulin suppressor and related RCC1 domain-containing protein-like protein [Paenibacillus curdlanolyticus YK9]